MIDLPDMSGLLVAAPIRSTGSGFSQKYGGNLVAPVRHKYGILVCVPQKCSKPPSEGGSGRGTDRFGLSAETMIRPVFPEGKLLVDLRKERRFLFCPITCGITRESSFLAVVWFLVS